MQNLDKPTTPTFSHEPTSHPDIFRLVDRYGEWTHYWIKSLNLYVPAVNHIIRIGYPKGERFYSYLLNAEPQEAEKRLKSAGEEGARTHEAIRMLIAGEKVTRDTQFYNSLIDRYEVLTFDEWENLEAFAAWCQKYSPKVLVHEQTVWSKMHGFAGTVDFVGTITIPEGDKNIPKELWNQSILIVLDWKTSSGIWDEYELQVAAYRKAVLEQLTSVLVPINKPLWTGIVRLGTAHKSGFEIKVWDQEQSDENFDLFRAAMIIYRRKEGTTFVPDIQQIPTEFAITIPRL